MLPIFFLDSDECSKKMRVFVTAEEEGVGIGGNSGLHPVVEWGLGPC
jgi:hypothetical protein